MLRPASKLPEPKRFSGKEAAYERDLREFARSKMEVAVIEVPGKSAKQVAQNVCAYLRNHRDKYPDVRCALRDGVAYLYREEQR